MINIYFAAPQIIDLHAQYSVRASRNGELLLTAHCSPLLPQLLPLKRPCSRSRSGRAICNPQLGVWNIPFSADLALFLNHQPYPWDCEIL